MAQKKPAKRADQKKADDERSRCACGGVFRPMQVFNSRGGKPRMVNRCGECGLEAPPKLSNPVILTRGKSHAAQMKRTKDQEQWFLDAQHYDFPERE